MIVIVDDATGAVTRIVQSIEGIDMSGLSAIDPPADFDPVAVSHILVAGEWQINLNGRKAILVEQVNARAEAIRCLHLTPGSGQAITYARKEDEARAWTVEADPASFPFLSAEAAATGASLADTAALVLDQANAWVTLGSAIEGHRRGLIVAIEAAADSAALDAIDTGAGWPGA